jgi:hypothetical protein
MLARLPKMPLTGHLAKACETKLPAGTGATQSKLAAPFVTPVKPPISHLRFSADSLSVTTTMAESNGINAALTEEINDL